MKQHGKPGESGKDALEEVGIHSAADKELLNRESNWGSNRDTNFMWTIREAAVTNSQAECSRTER